MTQGAGELEAQWMERHAIKAPTWVPCGWDSQASKLIFDGSAEIRREAVRLFSLTGGRSKSFWALADKAHSARPKNRYQLDIDWFRRATLIQLWSQGGSIPSKTVKQISAERKKAGIALRRFQHSIAGLSEIESLKIPALMKFAGCDAGSVALALRSPTLKELLLALGQRLSASTPLGALDPIVHRNELVLQPGRDDARVTLFETSLTDHFFTATGKAHADLVSIAIEMVGLQKRAAKVSARDVANRQRRKV